jgi:FkbM family methyltransferase
MSGGMVRVRDLAFAYNDPHDLLGIIESTVFDVYESRRIRAGSVVLDIGAGIGDFAVVASRRVGERGRVIAIEPNPEDFETLSRNLSLNHCDNVSLSGVAISEGGEKSVELRFKGRTFLSPAKRLREVLSDSGSSDFGTPSFVKMDVEGGETEIVPANLDVLRSCDCVAMEFHDGSQNSLAPTIEAQGFTFRRVRKQDYILKTAGFSMTHPVQSYRLYQAVKRSPAFHGLGKFAKGLDISHSEGLMVGVFHRVSP